MTGPADPVPPSAPRTPPEETHRTEVLAEEPAEALAGILDLTRPRAAGAAGAELPALWHWLYLLPRPAQRDLGPDGHPTCGIPAPPGPGRRRMFAGGRVTTLARLKVGTEAARRTWIADTTDKQGRSGPLSFVTVRHEITQGGQTAVIEEQDIVYRAPGRDQLPATGDAPPAPPVPADDRPILGLAVTETLLFRFSALTYNAHRIHYDRQWAREEGYADLVVHGPLQALMMGELMRRNAVDILGLEFRYRLTAPMVGPQRLAVAADDDGLAHGAETRDARGTVTAVSTLGPAGP